MSDINQIYNDRVKYILSCNAPGFEEMEITAPIGWNNDSKEYSRNEEYHGIFAKFSNSLKFIEDGADYINYARDILDINAPLKLTKYEKHPQTDQWIKTYWGYLDMSTWSFEKNQVSIKFNSGGLEQIIRARESESVEIDRLDTMDGTAMDPLSVNEVLFEGRRIFLKSKWEPKLNIGEVVDIGVFSDDGDTGNKTEGVPMNLINQSHEQAKSVLINSEGQETEGNTGMMMFANFDRERQVRIYSDSFKFKPRITRFDYQWAYFKVCLTVYENGINYDLKERRVLFHAGENSTSLPNVQSIQDNLYSIAFDETFDVVEGDSIALEFFIKADLQNESGARFTVKISELESNVFAEEDSFFEPSNSKFVLVHDLLDRLTTICSSAVKAIYSEYFGRTDLGYPENGPGAFVGVTHGFWIRGFDKLPLSTDNVQNLFKPLTTSLKDAITSCIAVHNVGMGIEEINNKERIRIEPLSYFYNPNVTIKLPNQVQNVKRIIASDFYCSSVNIGYESGGDYSEAQGLDEPNGKSTFTTVITRLKKTFSRLSIYRADSYGKEFARRKPQSRYDSLDTQYDEDKWFLDLKKGLTPVFLQRKCQDDFEQVPTGIFAPETADNLRLSPFNMLLRHGWVVAAGLTKYPTDYLRYGSSTANSQLRTKLIGGNEYAENGNIINSELGAPRFVPEWVEFEHECSFNVMQMVQGTTVILGKTIQNFYGTIEYKVSDNVWERGFLFNLKPNGRGSWKVLRSNRR